MYVGEEGWWLVRGFALGIVVTLLIIFVGGYLFIKEGGVSMATSAQPLPLEKTVAHLALHASIGNAGDDKDALPVDDTNMVAGVTLYRQHCAVCHASPGQQPSAIAKGMFPLPPQLFEKDDMVTDDPEGVTYWKVTNGIRLSGMPGFEKTLSNTERWQVTMLLAHADKLSPAAKAAFSH